MKINEISLREVYNHLINIIGNQSYILSDCIRSIVKIEKNHKLENSINTLAVDNDGRLYVSEKFCEDFVKDNKALTAFLMHELMHTVLADTAFMTRIDKKDPERDIKLLAANVAFDSRINAILYLLYDKELEVLNNFKNIYENEDIPPNPIYCLLYAGNESAVKNTFGNEAHTIYKNYYNTNEIKDFYRLYEIVLDYLRNNKDQQDQNQKIILIGSHGEDGIKITDENGKEIEISSETAEAIGEAISDAIREKALKEGDSKKAGHNDKLVQNIIPALEKRIDKTIPSELLRKIAVTRLSSNMKMAATKKVAKWTTSPVVPQRLAKSDIISTMFGLDVMLWKHHKITKVFDPKLVPIYFDVSGSMTSYIPLVLDLILNIDARIDHIWCFSDFVEKHSLQDLKERKIRSSGGTSFDAVIQHISDSNFTHVMVITDGECGVSKRKPVGLYEVVTVLTPNGDKNNWFSKNFENNTHELKDLTEGVCS
jgi:hypothetical protein